MTVLDSGPFYGSPVEIAADFLQDNGANLAIPPTIELGLDRTGQWRDTTTIHLLQYHHGIPVVGGGLVLHLNGGVVVRVVSDIRHGLSVGTEPGMTSNKAVLAVNSALRVSPLNEPRLTLAVYPTTDGGRLVYRGVVSTDRVTTWFVEIDAHTGLADPPVRFGAQANASVYPINPEASELTTVELTHLLGDETVLDGQYVEAYAQTGDTRFAAADDSGDFVYEPDIGSFTDPFAEVSGYYHLTNVAKYFDETHELRFDDPIALWVNWTDREGTYVLNAFAGSGPSGERAILVGQSETVDLAYDGITYGHEFGHHVFDERNNVWPNNPNYPIMADEEGFHPAPHAINEGSCDYWAATIFDESVHFYTEDTEAGYNDRDVDNAMRCPDDIWGEAHLDAPIVSGAFWEIREEIGAELADEVVYAVLGQLSDSPTFAELGALLAQATATLEEDGDIDLETAEVLQAAIVARGLPDCERSVPVEAGEPVRGNIPGAEAAARLAGMEFDVCPLLRGSVAIPLAFNYAITVPDEPVEALLIDIDMVRFDGEPFEEDDLSYEVLLRRNEPIIFDVSPLPLGDDPLELPTSASGVDLVFEDSPSDLRISVEELAAEAGDVYYVNLLGLLCHSVNATTTLDWEFPTAPDQAPDAGSDTGGRAEDDESRDDDGCRTAPQGSAPTALIWLILGLGLIGRHRAS